jgi:hypothetical protein
VESKGELKILNEILNETSPEVEPSVSAEAHRPGTATPDPDASAALTKGSISRNRSLEASLDA